MRFRIAQSNRACRTWRFVALPWRSTFWQLHAAVAFELNEPASFPEFLLKDSPLGRRVLVGVAIDLVDGSVLDARKIRIRDHFRAPGDSCQLLPASERDPGPYGHSRGHCASVILKPPPGNSRSRRAMAPRLALPTDYADVLAEIKRRVETERVRTIVSANSAMVLLYWDIGRMILERRRVPVGHEDHRSALDRPRPKLSGDGRFLTAKLEVHARICDGVARAINCARGPCTIAVVPKQRTARKTRPHRGTTLVRAPGARKWMVA